jgi:hypothetical protein
MSETAWIVMTVAAWVLVMGAISVFADIAKESDHARSSLVDDDRSREGSRPREVAGSRS